MIKLKYMAIIIIYIKYNGYSLRKCYPDLSGGKGEVVLKDPAYAFNFY
jgi:hypothetical protein